MPQSERRRGADAIVVASRGIWTTPERQKLARRFSRLGRRVEVISDAEAALLGALGDRPGILILSGTGSIVLARRGARWARAGGLGPLLGDEGSAFWIGREWLRGGSERDGLLPARKLARAPDAVRRIAALAPDVLRRARLGDRRARSIARAAQDHLAADARSVARPLGLGPRVDVSWAGSVMADEWFRRGVARALTRAGVAARWHTPTEEPAVAAARRAHSLIPTH